jgi:hypothetical protein
MEAVFKFIYIKYILVYQLGIAYNKPIYPVITHKYQLVIFNRMFFNIMSEVSIV